MGSSSFIHLVTATNAREAYSKLVESAIEEYGRDIYNGRISTCDMGRLVKSYDKYTITNEKQALQIIADMDNGRKWYADYIDLGVVEYKVITLKKETVQNKPPVIRVKYTVREKNLMYNTGIEKYFDTKTEADNYALKLSIQNPNKEYEVHKEGVLIEGKTLQTRIVREVKSYKTKPKLKEMPNRVIIPIHKYIFFGWASV